MKAIEVYTGIGLINILLLLIWAAMFVLVVMVLLKANKALDIWLKQHRGD